MPILFSNKLSDALSTICANFSVRSLVAFLCVGGASTAAHYLVMLLLMRTGLPVAAASGTGFALSALLNYLLNEQLTFHSDPHGNAPRRVTAPRFAAVAVTGLLLNHLLLTALMHAGLPAVPAQLLTTMGVIVWNYAIHGAWTFRRHRNSGRN
jgi:putative flippase GtrA